LAKRYFIAPDQLTAAEPQIAGEDAHHLRSVLRVRPGTLISVFDGTGMDYRAKVTAVNREGITVALIEQIPARRESLLSITVAQGFLKDKKMDTLVRQLTELGVTRWAPFLAQRSVPLPTAKRLESAEVAQSVEQGTENPRVGSSILSLGTSRGPRAGSDFSRKTASVELGEKSVVQNCTSAGNWNRSRAIVVRGHLSTYNLGNGLARASRRRSIFRFFYCAVA
jgi:hypothetical protein